MAKKTTPPNDSDAALKTLDMLQELVWAIKSRESSELLLGVAHLRQLASSERKKTSAKAKAAEGDKRESLRALVGAMPLILADSELFPTNEDIAKFALEALQITISRWEKRSRYEMIGMLVMESINASDANLRDVSRLVEKVSDESDSLDEIKQSSRKTGFSWNQAIRNLSSSVE